MKYLTFPQIKAQLRLDDEQAELEKDLLTLYGESAEQAVFNTLNRTYTEVYEQHGDIPSAIVVATLLVVEDAYTNRGTISTMSVQHLPTFDLLLKPYMKLTSNNDEYGRHCNL
jgi:hypothetical protein